MHRANRINPSPMLATIVSRLPQPRVCRVQLCSLLYPVALIESLQGGSITTINSLCKNARWTEYRNDENHSRHRAMNTLHEMNTNRVGFCAGTYFCKLQSYSHNANRVTNMTNMKIQQALKSHTAQCSPPDLNIFHQGTTYSRQ